MPDSVGLVDSQQPWLGFPISGFHRALLTHLRLVSNSEGQERIDEGRGLSAVLSGRSPVTEPEERVTVFTRELPDGHVIYALVIAPGQDYDELGPTFQRMISSLRENDETSHR